MRMATVALGKTRVQPAISAAFWTQDYFRARKTPLYWSPQLSFFDDQGKTLGFVPNVASNRVSGVRIYTDPTLSFELLALKSLADKVYPGSFAVTDSVNHQLVGAIKRMPSEGLQRRQWLLLDAAEQGIGFLSEDRSFLRTRRVFTDVMAQSYTFILADQPIGKATQRGRFLSYEIRVDLSGDHEKRLDRRLAAAAILVLTGNLHPGD
jgi:hypothetical protein